MSNKQKIGILAAVVLVTVAILAFLTLNNFKSIDDDKGTEISTVEIIKPKQEPILELTQEEVDLEVGSIFEFEDFIKVAEDENGYNIKDTVSVTDTISTEVPGSYQVEYTLQLKNGKSISKQLKINIIEFKKSDGKH